MPGFDVRSRGCRRRDAQAIAAADPRARSGGIVLAVLVALALLCGCDGRKPSDGNRPGRADRVADPAPAARPQPDSDEAAADAAAPLSARSPAVTVADPHRLEAGFVSGGAFSAQAAAQAMRSQDSFERLLAALEQGFGSDPDANEIARLLRGRFSAALARAGGGVALERLACGQRICAASLQGEAIAPSKLLEALLSADSDGDAKIQSSSIKRVEPARPGAPAGYRIVFSTDPATAAIVARP